MLSEIDLTPLLGLPQLANSLAELDADIGGHLPILQLAYPLYLVHTLFQESEIHVPDEIDAKREGGWKIFGGMVAVIFLILGTIGDVMRGHPTSALWHTKGTTVQPLSDMNGSSTASPNNPDSPIVKEQQWLRDNLPSENFYKAGVETLDGRQIGSTSEHHVIEVTAAENETWNLTATEITNTTYFAGTPEERNGRYQEQTTCAIQFMKIPWRESWIVKESVNRAEDSVGALSEKYELEVVGDKDKLGCATESQFSGQPAQTSEKVPVLRLTFPDRHSAEMARLVIIAHTTYVTSEPHQ